MNELHAWWVEWVKGWVCGVKDGRVEFEGDGRELHAWWVEC